MLKELQACHDVHDLAALLQIEAKMLTYLLYTLPESAKYHLFCISKKNGGTRQISAPDDRLKSLQRRLHALLTNCDLQIQDSFPRNSSMGCENGKHLEDNARLHSNRRWVFNIDLENFFGEFNFGRVISYFKKNTNFNLDPKIATYIAQICVHDNQLPQGAPTSPLVANLICSSFDYRLAKFASYHRCTYTRYVDDITFSTNKSDFPLGIARRTKKGWLPSKMLVDRISDSGFSINQKKTRMDYRRSRQVVTGLVVNEEPTVEREYRRKCRAAVHEAMQGKKFFADTFCQPFTDNCAQPPENVSFENDLNRIECRLSFIHNVERQRKKFNQKRQMHNPTGIFKTYSDAILLRKLCRDPEPLIITEGPSDTLYLKAGILTLDRFFPDLSKLVNGKQELAVSFQRTGSRSARIVGLGSGNGDLDIFLSRAANFYKRLSGNIARRRVIILVDNDDGLNHLRKTLKNVYKLDIKHSDQNSFFKLEDNFYLIKTPSLPQKLETAIEDFLPPNALVDLVTGKTFSADKNYDTKRHFGKVDLGRKIYQQRHALQLSTLNPILRRIDSALKD